MGVIKRRVARRLAEVIVSAGRVEPGIKLRELGAHTLPRYGGTQGSFVSERSLAFGNVAADDKGWMTTTGKGGAVDSDFCKGRSKYDVISFQYD